MSATDRNEKERPGVIRLRAMDARPQDFARARAIIAAVVAPPVVRQPRKPKPRPAEQGTLFEQD